MQPTKMFLHSISFKNFFSFKDEGQLNFVVNNNAPNTKDYVSVGKNRRVNKILAVYGANASGKTNALKAISFLKWLLDDSYKISPNDSILFLPFLFQKSGRKQTYISTTFSVDNDLYQYTTKFTKDKIISEQLKKKNILTKRSRFSLLFKRHWVDDHYEWQNNFKLDKSFIKEKGQRKNSSVLAIALRDNHTETLKIANFWQHVNHNITFKGTANNDFADTITAAEILYKYPKIRQKFSQIISKFDLGLSNIQVEQIIDDLRKTIYRISGIHVSRGKEYQLAFEFESSGTKKVFQVLPIVLLTFSYGGVLVLDEFDSYMHPAMSEAIVEMFKDSEYNPYDAQLVVSAHGATLLNLFDKYQIALVEKNEQGESYIWRLDQMKGVRLDENYYGKYLAGVYGGVPDIDI